MFNCRRHSRLMIALVALLTFTGLPDVRAGQFKLGVEVFVEGFTHLTRGKRVGLLTNQSGVNAQGSSTIDLLYQSRDVHLVKLFSPEHGIRGKVKAGKHVSNSRDSETGLPIISLYGKNGYRPKPQHLADIDVLIYDIQDVGSRAYTYIWSMGEALTACGKEGVQMIVLDRPCVFGATVIDGPLCNPGYKSLLTRFPIPRLYGMTCGEIARYFNGAYKMGCQLTVIPMAGYQRGMQYEHTGLRWIAPSPNIPNLNAARCFPATGTLGEMGSLHIGIGTNLPFQIVGAPWLDAQRAARDLNASGLTGIRFGYTSFASPKGSFYAGKRVQALTLNVTDPAHFKPATAELVMLNYFMRLYPSKVHLSPKRAKQFDRAMGTATVRTSILNNEQPAEIVGKWEAQQATFARYRRLFLLYP